MEYGKFTNNGRSYTVTTPYTPTEWKNMLFNDSYLAEVSQTLRGSGSTVDDYKQKKLITGREFYVLDRKSGKVFCPSVMPLHSKLDSYSCVHGIFETAVTAACGALKAELNVFVPSEAQCEIWRIKVKNTSDTKKEISVFSAFPFSGSSPMGGICRYSESFGIMYKYSFPYHVFYEDKEKVENDKAYYYIYPSVKPHSFDGDSAAFYGTGEPGAVPEAVKNGECSGCPGETNGFVGAMEHRFDINGGEEISFSLIVSSAKSLEEAEQFAKNLNIDHEYEKTRGLWEKRISSFIIETPDENLNYMVNYWVKKQTVFLSRLNRLSTYCPVRNQLQDALGYSLIEPEEALKTALRVTARQMSDGFLKQWYMTDGSPDKKLCLVKHADAPVWLIICLTAIADSCGDISVYDREVGYIDSKKTDSLYIHLVKAARFLSDMKGAHGLCLMLDGDWTDPINGAGRKGRGESVWTTLASVYAFKRLREVALLKNDGQTAEMLSEKIREFSDAVNEHCWDSDRYITGFDDDGEPFGKRSDEEAQIFLNTQTWAIISGVAVGERAEKCVRSVEKITTPFGPLLLYPAFTGWNGTWGRISIKQRGTTENGSVYCHGSMFKAYSDCVRNDGSAAYKTIVQTLPQNPDNPPEKNKQFPTFIPNYYFGIKDSPNFGRSSCHYGTGSAAWMLWVTVCNILGCRNTVDGMKINPCLPEDWKNAAVTINGKRISLTD